MAVKPKEFKIALATASKTLKHVFIMHSSLGGPRYGVLDTYNAKAYYKKGIKPSQRSSPQKGKKKFSRKAKNKKISAFKQQTKAK